MVCTCSGDDTIGHSTSHRITYKNVFIVNAKPHSSIFIVENIQMLRRFTSQKCHLHLAFPLHAARRLCRYPSTNEFNTIFISVHVFLSLSTSLPPSQPISVTRAIVANVCVHIMHACLVYLFNVSVVRGSSPSSPSSPSSTTMLILFLQWSHTYTHFTFCAIFYVCCTQYVHIVHRTTYIIHCGCDQIKKRKSNRTNGISFSVCLSWLLLIVLKSLSKILWKPLIAFCREAECRVVCGRVADDENSSQKQPVYGLAYMNRIYVWCEKPFQHIELQIDGKWKCFFSSILRSVNSKWKRRDA